MAKKDKASKLPKSIGGVKVPKQLRKTAKTALEIAQNPLAREIVSAAVVAGAAALSKRQGGKTAPAAAPAPSAHNGIDIGALIAQGVAAFVSGFDKGSEMVSGNKASPANGTSDPKSGPKPKP